MNDLAIQLSGVGKTYPFFSLEDVDLEVPVGTIAGLIGANGAGKSTTIRILVGLVRQDRGMVRVLGHDMTMHQVAAKQHVGFVSEDIGLYKSATLAWHIEFIRSIFGQWDEAYGKRLLRRFDLHPGQKIQDLSRGQRIKAVLLLALARRPRLLVLDEPTAGLDPIARREVLRALSEVLADEDRARELAIDSTSDAAGGRLTEPAGGNAGRRNRSCRHLESQTLRTGTGRNPQGRWSYRGSGGADDSRRDLRRGGDAGKRGKPSMSISGRSGARIVMRLIRKDFFLQRRLSAASLVGSIVALGLIASGGEARFYLGTVLLVTVLIGLGATLAALTVVEERQQQTLPFIMSLPVSSRQLAIAKILANLLIFGTTWSVLLLGGLGLILISDKLANGLVVYTLIGFTEILLSTSVILAAAMITRSMPWTIGTMMCGNLVFNSFAFWILRAPAFVAAAESPQVVWPPQAATLLLAELVGIVLMLGIAYTVSTRRKDVL